jgi:hypothetical protein
MNSEFYFSHGQIELLHLVISEWIKLSQMQCVEIGTILRHSITPPPHPKVHIGTRTKGGGVKLTDDPHLPTSPKECNDSSDNTQDTEETQLSGHQHLNINLQEFTLKKDADQQKPRNTHAMNICPTV